MTESTTSELPMARYSVRLAPSTRDALNESTRMTGGASNDDVFNWAIRLLHKTLVDRENERTVLRRRARVAPYLAALLAVAAVGVTIAVIGGVVEQKFAAGTWVAAIAWVGYWRWLVRRIEQLERL